MINISEERLSNLIKDSETMDTLTKYFKCPYYEIYDRVASLIETNKTLKDKRDSISVVKSGVKLLKSGVKLHYIILDGYPHKELKYLARKYLKEI